MSALPKARPADMVLEPPLPADGGAMWQLVRDMGGLELNSAYCYLLYARDFADTCIVARSEGRLAGFVLGHVPPARPDTVFVWQIGVAPEGRGRGLAQRMLEALVARGRWRYLEASVTPDNTASERLFTGFARRAGAECEESVFIPAGDFPESHPTERLFRIGPLATDPV